MSDWAFLRSVDVFCGGNSVVHHEPSAAGSAIGGGVGGTGAAGGAVVGAGVGAVSVGVGFAVLAVTVGVGVAEELLVDGVGVELPLLVLGEADELVLLGSVVAVLGALLVTGAVVEADPVSVGVGSSAACAMGLKSRPRATTPHVAVTARALSC